MTRGASIRFGRRTLVALLWAGVGTAAVAQEATARDEPRVQTVTRQPMRLDASATLVASVQISSQSSHTAPQSATVARTRSATADRKAPEAAAREDALASAQCELEQENQTIVSWSVRSAMRPCAAHTESRRPFGPTL